MVEVQHVDPAHDRKVNRRHRLWLIVEAAPAQLQQHRLACQRQTVAAVDHRLALNSPALLSALDKESSSSASSPILACRTFTSTAGMASAPTRPAPNPPAAPSDSCAFHAVIWFGCTSYCGAKSASVFSPLRAANATLALKTGLWVRR